MEGRHELFGEHDARFLQIFIFDEWNSMERVMDSDHF